MTPRSAGPPILVGLATAAVLAVGGISAFADEPTDPADAKPELFVNVSTSSSKVQAGQTATLTIRAWAEHGAFQTVRFSSVKVEAPGEVSVTGNCPRVTDSDGCSFGPLGAQTQQKTLNLSTSRSLQKAVSARVSLSVLGTRTDGTTDEEVPADAVIQFSPVPAPKPKPQPPTQTPKPKPKPTETLTPGKEKDNGGGGGGGAGSNNGGGTTGGGNQNGTNNPGTNTGNAGGTGYPTPSPNGSFTQPPTTQSPQVALPPVAPPSPSVAPGAPPTPESRLRNNHAPVAQDLTFERMASTQVAWLAALLVAFSLLMTQLRLGRRRNTPGAARAADQIARNRGLHRRPRRGMFGR